MPGTELPSDTILESQTIELAGAAVDSTGSTRIQEIIGSEVEIVDVRVTATAADFNFQITVNGSNVYGTAQSPTGTTEQSFFPTGQNAYWANINSAIVAFDVTSASGTTGATATVDVLTRSHKE